MLLSSFASLYDSVLFAEHRLLVDKLSAQTERPCGKSAASCVAPVPGVLPPAADPAVGGFGPGDQTSTNKVNLFIRLSAVRLVAGGSPKH